MPQSRHDVAAERGEIYGSGQEIGGRSGDPTGAEADNQRAGEGMDTDRPKNITRQDEPNSAATVAMQTPMPQPQTQSCWQ